MNMPLRELQEQFQAYVLQDKPDILQLIATQGANPKERINIYSKGYLLRLLEILEKDFPNFKKYIGEEEFDKLGRNYIKNYPSDNFNICIFSRHLTHFIEKTLDQPHWSELVQFEWALSCVLDSPDAPHLKMEDLGTVDGEQWPNLQFTFHPSVQVHEFHYNTTKIFRALMEDSNEVPFSCLNESPTNWFVWRFDRIPYFESMTTEQSWMVKAIQQHKTFSQICEGLCEWVEEEKVAEFAAGSLGNWLQKGLLSSYSIAD